MTADMSLGELAGKGFNQTLGLELTEATGDRVTATLEVLPHLHQPYGITHGGVLCSIVETVASVGGAVWFGDRGEVVGVANSTNFLRATREGTLTAVGTPITRGRTQQLWEVRITDGSDRLIAQGQVRLANIASAGQLGNP